MRARSRALSRRMRTLAARIGTRFLYEEADLFGHRLVLRAGTLPETPDYDDAWFVALARQARVLFDIGCNVGEMSLMFLLLRQQGRAVAVDANPEAVAITAENLFRNGLGARAGFVSAFVGSAPGEEVEFFTVGAGQAGSKYEGHARSAARRSRSLTVRTTTLDLLVDEAGSCPDLVKIDVEGAEAEVLEGATRVAASGARFLVEVHSPPELPMQENLTRILKWCDRSHYQAHYLKDHVPLNDASSAAHRGRCHVLLLPEGEAYPEPLRQIRQGDPVDVALRF